MYFGSTGITFKVCPYLPFEIVPTKKRGKKYGISQNFLRRYQWKKVWKMLRFGNTIFVSQKVYDDLKIEIETGQEKYLKLLKEFNDGR